MGMRDFPESTTVAMGTVLLNNWNRQTVEKWDGVDHHYLYWMD
jgi:hypothetical protein